jgi:PEGA domain
MYMRSIILSLLTMMSVGCATMARGTRQDVRIETQPSDAVVWVNGHEYAPPVELTLKRNETYQVRVASAGYQPIEFDLKARWDGMSLASLILPLGSLWTATDVATGADKAFPKLRTVVLKPSEYPTAPFARLREYRGYLLTEKQYADAVQYERDQSSMDWRN